MTIAIRRRGESTFRAEAPAEPDAIWSVPIRVRKRARFLANHSLAGLPVMLLLVVACRAPDGRPAPSAASAPLDAASIHGGQSVTAPAPDRPAVETTPRTPADLDPHAESNAECEALTDTTCDHGVPEVLPLPADATRTIPSDSPLHAVRLLRCETAGLLWRNWWGTEVGRVSTQPCSSAVSVDDKVVWFDDAGGLHVTDLTTLRSSRVRTGWSRKCGAGRFIERCDIVNAHEAKGPKSVLVHLHCVCNTAHDDTTPCGGWVEVPRGGGTARPVRPLCQGVEDLPAGLEDAAGVDAAAGPTRAWAYSAVKDEQRGGGRLDIVANLPGNATRTVARMDGECPDDWLNSLHNFSVRAESASGRWQILGADFFLDPGRSAWFWLFDRIAGRVYPIRAGAWPEPIDWNRLRKIEYLAGQDCAGALEMTFGVAERDRAPWFHPTADLVIIGYLHVVPGLGGWIAR